ncbi:amidohydrolase [Corynebacterium sp. MSK297]|uniref:amidohydrolase n=1 Tax=Corynebacterium sp. MSK297 TaxID=3050221 RepID=UPI00254C9F91|nr:amidohydrolase [Corynebacterium sp. MSK297]MDK8846700.1 amidohydrolase [Corynebacterium sp. MSK297]
MDIASFVAEWIEHHHDEVIGWRRHIHRNPDLSHKEHATTDFLCGVLEEYGLQPHRFPETGLYVDIGDDYGKGRLGFRADIDALPIQELTGVEFASQIDGVSHSCGHDIHTTVALGLACALGQLTNAYPGALSFGVRVIFQPAEEVMTGGAVNVIEWGALAGVSALYAVHAEPKLKVGQIGIRTGAITSASDVIEISVSGTGGHTSRPHLTSDVVYALGKLVTELPAVLSRRVDPRTGTVVVFGAIHAGFAPNAIPEQGSVMGTLRTADISVWRWLRRELSEIIGEILAPTGVDYVVTHDQGVPPVLNDEVATALLTEAVTSIDPHAAVQAPQSSGGEDFSWYLEHVPGSMARLGCWSGTGEMQDLHQGNFDPDERSVSVGIRLFAGIVARYEAQAR